MALAADADFWFTLPVLWFMWNVIQFDSTYDTPVLIDTVILSKIYWPVVFSIPCCYLQVSVARFKLCKLCFV